MDRENGDSLVYMESAKTTFCERMHTPLCTAELHLEPPIRRREDPRLITGQSTYVDDIKLPGMLHMTVLRSPYAHARITSIDTTAALSHPGVRAVYTAADLKGVVANMPVEGKVGKIAEGMGIRGPLAEDTAVGGSALYTAVQRLKEKMRLIASHMLEASVDDVVLADGKFSVQGSPNKSVTFNDVTLTANTSNHLHLGIEPGLENTSFWEPPAMTVPFGTHICVVEIDKDTGKAEITRFVAVDDCGNQINPMLVEGQVHGGLAQGIGQALLEGVVYNEEGQLMTATLMDYALPMAAEFPEFETESTVTPTPVNPLGAKGVGEAGTIGSIPAIANAVADALGVVHIDTPFTPEKLWQIIHK